LPYFPQIFERVELVFGLLKVCEYLAGLAF